MSIFFWKKESSQISIKDVFKKQYDTVRPVLESLKSYDEGKKEIPVSDIKLRFDRVRNSTR